MSFDKAIYQLCLERKRKQACYANNAKNNKKKRLANVWPLTPTIKYAELQKWYLISIQCSQCPSSLSLKRFDLSLTLSSQLFLSTLRVMQNKFLDRHALLGACQTSQDSFRNVLGGIIQVDVGILLVKTGVGDNVGNDDRVPLPLS